MNSVFLAIIMRAPTSAELSAAQSYLTSGATLGALTATVAYGAAATNALKPVIQNVYGWSANSGDTA